MARNTRTPSPRSSGHEPAFRDTLSPENSLEVFDESGRFLLVMPKESVLRQRLVCRATVVALMARMDNEERVFLCKLSRRHPVHPGLWDISASSYLFPGESFLDAALRSLAARLVRAEMNLAPVVHMPPTPETRNRELVLFKSRPGSSHPPLRPEGEVEDTLFVDREELAALMRDMPELTTPALRLAAGHVFASPALP